MASMGQCLPDGVLLYQTWKGIATEFIGSCLAGLATMGPIPAGKVASFSLSIYFPQLSELKTVIEENEQFESEILERLEHPVEDNLPLDGAFVLSVYRPIFSGVIDEHFGDGISRVAFQHFLEKFARNPPDFTGCR